MILWTDFVALGLVALVLLVFRAKAPQEGLPPQVARLVRVLEVMVVLLLVVMVLMVRGQ